MDPYMGSFAAKYDREVFPEFSEPMDYSECMPLSGSSKYNIKQGMKFIKNDKKANQRFHPYTQPSSSTTSSFTNRHSLYRPGSLNEKQAVDSKKNNAKDKNNENFNRKQVRTTHTPFRVNEQKMSVNTVKNKTNTFRSNFIMNEDTKSLRQRMNLPGSRIRHFVGSVDQVLRWHKSVKNSDLFVMYEANGILECKRSQEKKHLLFIRGESGHILQAVFYEIDRPIPLCNEKSPVLVTGRMIGFRKMQVFDIVLLSQEDYQAIQRLSFLSQRALNEALE
ncbi:uncharacterized protein isoform X2 [Rhodnius prolixus]